VNQRLRITWSYLAFAKHAVFNTNRFSSSCFLERQTLISSRHAAAKGERMALYIIASGMASYSSCSPPYSTRIL
jgi:hypothetical protein